MSETYYKKKRVKSGMTKSDMAKELGTDYTRYDLIEKGRVKMPTKLIDRFNEIVNKGKTSHSLSKLENERLVNEFWDEISTNTSGKYGDYKLKEKLKEFNIKNFRELANLVGMSSSNLSHYLAGRHNAPYDIKNRIYLFFQDELNIQPENRTVKPVVKNVAKKTTSNRGPGKRCTNQELLDWYKNVDLKAFVKDNGLTYGDISRATGLHGSCVSRTVRKTSQIPSERTLYLFKEYVNNMTKNNTVEDILPEEKLEEIFPEIGEITDERFEDTVIKNESAIVRKYEEELLNNNELIEMYKNYIRDLELRNKVCEEVLKVADELRGE